MTKKLQKQLAAIKPGKTYPSVVDIVEPTGQKIQLQMNSFYVGMYCAVYVNGNMASQGGHFNQTTFIRRVKKDILKAVSRGAKVKIGGIANVKLTFED